MHEMSIIEALLEQVDKELHAHPGMRLRNVQMHVGSLRHVVPEMLTFCYDAAVRGTAMEGSRLEVKELPAEARCSRCSLTFAVEAGDWLECPRCQVTGAGLLHGDELQLTSLELTRAA
jgi:hydrogenase nickel incorporation protein HypA/HybF